MKALWFGIAILLLIAAGIWLGHDYLQQRADIHNPKSPVGRKIDEALPLQYASQYQRLKRGVNVLEMANIRTAIQMYQLNYGKDPESLQDLIDTRCISEGALQDTFRQDYRLRKLEGRWALMSSGNDQILNTEDDVVLYLDGVMMESPAAQPTAPKPEGRSLDWYTTPQGPTGGTSPAGP